MKKNTASVVDALLRDVKPKITNAISNMPELAEAIVHFLDLKKLKDQRVKGLSFEWFYVHKLQVAYEGPSINTARRYAREILKRDVKTGDDL